MKVISMSESAIETIDQIMSFEEWSKDFRTLNREKKGESWDLLNKLVDL